jgi:hypothetical protein
VRRQEPRTLRAFNENAVLILAIRVEMDAVVQLAALF